MVWIYDESIINFADGRCSCSSYPSSINTTETVLLSAHYDSRGSFGSTRAPGADDDGSGTVSILGIARTIARRRVQFESNVQLCLFAGEEQGLLGSRAYAREFLGVWFHLSDSLECRGASR